MLSYEEYKKVYNITQNEYIDLSSWRKENRENSKKKIHVPNRTPPTKLEILSQVKKEYLMKIDIFEQGIHYYNLHYDERKLYLNRKFYVKYILKLSELEEEFQEEFKKEFEIDIDFSVFK
jgi:hypothetical protein